MAERKSGKPRSAKPENAKPRRGAVKGFKAAPERPAAGARKGRLAATAQAPAAVRQTAKATAPPRARTRPPKNAPALAAAAPQAAAGIGRRGLPKPQPVEAASAREVVQSASDLALTEEERIESSKYDVRETPRRVFEEERFLFPETYEADRVRLLVKDPEWLFAHWDVSPGSLQRLRDDLGERAMALSRLTLKVEDPGDSALSVVLLPEGARSWYVKTHMSHRAYRAQLGLTMPSGEFRALATSNVVVAPRVGPSPRRATRRVAFSRAQDEQAAAELRANGALATSQAAEGAERRADRTEVDYIDGAAGPPRPEGKPADRGGASDELGPGGASDIFRR